VVWCSVKKMLSQEPALLVPINFREKFGASDHLKCYQIARESALVPRNFANSNYATKPCGVRRHDVEAKRPYRSARGCTWR
jgi:hypothetical protein